MNTRLTHQFGCSQIVFFVKTCFQFHENRHPFSILCCCNQCINHLRMLCYTILGNHNLTTHGIVYRLVQKMNKMVETMIRIMQQQILTGNPAVHEMRFFQSRQTHGYRLLHRLQVGIRIRKLSQILQIQMLVPLHQFFLRNRKDIHQKAQKVGRHLAVVHKAGYSPYLAFLYLLLQFLHHILRRYIVYKHIRIARNLTAETTIHLISGKNFLQIILDNIFQKHQIVRIPLLGKFHKARHLAVRHLHDKILRFLFTGLMHPHSQILTVIA